MTVILESFYQLDQKGKLVLKGLKLWMSSYWACRYTVLCWRNIIKYEIHLRDCSESNQIYFIAQMMMVGLDIIWNITVTFGSWGVVCYFFLPGLGALSRPCTYFRGIWYRSVIKEKKCTHIQAKGCRQRYKQSCGIGLYGT